MKLAHIACHNLSGLAKLVQCFEKLLLKSNFSVKIINPDMKAGHCDLCIHMEKVSPVNVELSSHNALVPMPEHVLSFDFYDKLDSVLCVNKYGFDIFKNIENKFNFKTILTGCTTFINKPFSLCDKDYNQAIHLAGVSPWKNTNLVLSTWKNNPHLPKLHVTCLDRSQYRSCFRENKSLIDDCSSSENIEIHHSPLSNDQISDLQSLAGLSICPSSAEGYSNYINESLHFGSIVITLDYPPMNELVNSNHGILIPSFHADYRGKFNISCRSFLESKLLSAIVKYLDMPLSCKMEKSINSHNHYIDNQLFFVNNFTNFLKTLQ